MGGKVMTILFMYIVCIVTALLAIFNDLIDNLLIVLLSISIGSCLGFVIRHFNIQPNNMLNYITNAFYIVPAVVCPATDIDDSFLFFMFGVCGIWALMFINMHLVNKFLETVLRLKNYQS